MTAGRRTAAAAFVAVAIVIACRQADDSARMTALGAALTKLTAAADASVAYDNPPADLDEAGLLAFVTSHDHTLSEPFSGYSVRVARENGHAVVLVCNRDRTRALLEDVACTMNVDRAAWQEAPSPPCTFTMRVNSACETSSAAAAGAPR